MSTGPAFPRAAEIEHSLERLAELCEDPTALVYERLFELQPEMKPYFWRDTNDAIKGEMLSRTFGAILDFVGERRYADHMIGTEMVTHEGYDVPREVFVTFFDVVRDAVRVGLGSDWTSDLESAWQELIAEIYRFANLTPRSDVTNAFHQPRMEAFRRGEPIS
ncbi:MAG: globin [Phenylobacterium sp.]|jgi:hemoglobin-like flavoprotein|uniref:globin n=1 Tax=Phenylobacterium sp. TaxID=1871053 RepID=UPI001B4B53CA|nr:globin [Phenylobacterium sp.]MBP7648248.1 globin [Phenylobacterium sp.]MBP7814857.1 globin [Phenylobacterium sp.]MBP9753400.1 globin [Phenylobacterium sp.]MDP1600213.1 globin [Phenylobacterium sp.]MDP3593610.1 globin [Phenylobacterium sp.]